MSQNDSNRVVIVAGSRTPFARAGTIFKKHSALDLAIHSVHNLLEKTQVTKEDIEEFVYGIVVTDPRILHLAREIVLASQLPSELQALTVTNNCITGLSAIRTIYDSILSERIEVGIAGGVESMSNLALLFSRQSSRIFLDAFAAKSVNERMREFLKLRPNHFKPTSPGIKEPSTGLSMGEHTELMVKEWKISQQEQDEIAYRSHMNAHQATEDGRLINEIAPLDGIESDQFIRPDTTLDKLAKLKPVFDRSETGTITAGNSSPLTDGAASILLMSDEYAKQNNYKQFAYVKDFEFVGIHPDEGLLMGPAIAVPKLLQRNSITLDDFDIIEMHEAFGGQIACNLKAWEQGWKQAAIGKVDVDKLNPLGSSIAIGHPFSSTGIRITTTLANEMQRRNSRLGLVSICGAGGTAAAMIIER